MYSLPLKDFDPGFTGYKSEKRRVNPKPFVTEAVLLNIQFEMLGNLVTIHHLSHF